MTVALAFATLGLYGLTTGQLVGYEGETAAVSEGLVKHGELQVLPGTPLTKEGILGRGGHRYSRTGLAQPVLEAPFYALGDGLDSLASGGRRYEWRLALLRLFNPVMAMLTVLAAFGLLRLRGRSLRGAAGVACLVAVGSLVWPYSKIGMDTTLMAAVAVAMLAAAWAANRPSSGRFFAAGAAAGFAITTKPYGLLLVLGMVPLLLGAVRAAPRPARLRLAAALAFPLVVGIASVGWYNAYRTGSVTNFLHSNPTDLVDTPLNAVGLLLSPGRGLLFYSPLVLLGALALRGTWTQDRPLAVAIILPVAINVVIIAATYVWTDDTWGPRYIVPTAWLLLLPLAWWRPTRRQLRTAGAVAVIAVGVQIVGVFAPFSASKVATREITHLSVWPTEGGATGPIPYGGDPARWVPQLSPILLNTEMMLAWIDKQATGNGFVVTYDPTWGTVGQLDLRNPGRAVHALLPDVWWRFPGESAGVRAIAVLLALAGLGGGFRLARLLRPHPASTPGARLPIQHA